MNWSYIYRINPLKPQGFGWTAAKLAQSLTPPLAVQLQSYKAETGPKRVRLEFFYWKLWWLKPLQSFCSVVVTKMALWADRTVTQRADVIIMIKTFLPLAFWLTSGSRPFRSDTSATSSWLKPSASTTNSTCRVGFQESLGYNVFCHMFPRKELIDQSIIYVVW